MLVKGFPAGPWGTNCFVLAASEGSECIVIDPGKDSMKGVDEIVDRHRLKPAAVILTHGHLDHIWSVVPLCGARDVPAFIHPGDRKLLSDPMAGISGETRMMFQQMTGGKMQFGEPDEVRELSHGQALDLVGLELVVSHAPGHTPGSVTFRTGDELSREVGAPVLFSGDLLFEGSIGRTDLPGGDMDQMWQSLVDVVLPLDDSTVVLPGHGAQTTIGRERATNPYLSEATLHARGQDGPSAPTRGL